MLTLRHLFAAPFGQAQHRFPQPRIIADDDARARCRKPPELAECFFAIIQKPDGVGEQDNIELSLDLREVGGVFGVSRVEFEPRMARRGTRGHRRCDVDPYALAAHRFGQSEQRTAIATADVQHNVVSSDA